MSDRSATPYPSLEVILNSFRVQEVSKAGSLLGIRLRGRKEEKINSIITYMNSQDQDNYRDYFGKIREILVQMRGNRNGWVPTPQLLPAMQGLPPEWQQGSKDPSVPISTAVGQEGLLGNSGAGLQAPAGGGGEGVQVAQAPSSSRVTRSTTKSRRVSKQQLQEQEVCSSTPGPNVQNSTAGQGVTNLGTAARAMPPPAARTPNVSTVKLKINAGKTQCICSDRHNVKMECLVCEDCGVRQHKVCVRGATPASGKVGPQYFCEWCRVKWADPFSKIVGGNKFQLLQSIRVVGQKDTEQTVQKKFMVDKKGSNLGKEYQLKIGCVQLNDPVDFRFHWPLHAKLKYNSYDVNVYRRQGQVKLGVNQRDDSVSIEIYTQRGENFLQFSLTDEGSYVLMVYMVKKQSIEEVKNMMVPAETLQDALQRVIRCVQQGDDDVVVDKQKVNLNCQITGSRIRIPARFKDRDSFTAAFDLDTFLYYNQKQLKWYCPHFMTPSRICNMQIDSYMQAVLSALENEQDVTEIEVNEKGQWRIGDEHPWQDVLRPSGHVRNVVNASSKRSFSAREGVFQGDAGAAVAAAAADDDDDEEELDEATELAQIAREVQIKRRKVQEKDNEVICVDLTGSEDGTNEELVFSRGAGLQMDQRVVFSSRSPQKASFTPVLPSSPNLPTYPCSPQQIGQQQQEQQQNSHQLQDMKPISPQSWIQHQVVINRTFPIQNYPGVPPILKSFHANQQNYGSNSGTSKFGGQNQSQGRSMHQYNNNYESNMQQRINYNNNRHGYQQSKHGNSLYSTQQNLGYGGSFSHGSQLQKQNSEVARSGLGSLQNSQNQNSVHQRSQGSSQQRSVNQSGQSQDGRTDIEQSSPRVFYQWQGNKRVEIIELD